MKKYAFLFTLIFGFSFVTNAQIQRSLKPLKKSTQKLFLKIDNLQGESKDAKHKNWIELKSFYFDNKQVGNSSKSYLFTFSKLPDVTSVLLAKNADTKKMFPEIVLEVTQMIKGKQLPVLKYTLKGATIDLYAIQKSTKTSLIENIKILCNSVEISHYKYDSTGEKSKTSSRTLNKRY